MGGSFAWFCDPVVCLLARTRAWNMNQNSCLPGPNYNTVLPRCAVDPQRRPRDTHRQMIRRDGLKRGTSVELTSGEGESIGNDEKVKRNYRRGDDAGRISW